MSPPPSTHNVRKLNLQVHPTILSPSNPLILPIQNPPSRPVPVLVPTLLGVAVEALLAQQFGALEVRQTLFRTGARTDAGGLEVTW